MKRLFAIFSAVCLFLCVAVGYENVVAQTDEPEFFHGVYYQVPDDWSKVENTEDMFWYYPPSGGLLQIQFMGVDLPLSYRSGFLAGMEDGGLTFGDEIETTVNGRTGYHYVGSGLIAEEDYLVKMTLFDSSGGTFCILLATPIGGEVSYLEEYLAIVDSITESPSGVSSEPSSDLQSESQTESEGQIETQSESQTELESEPERQNGGANIVPFLLIGAGIFVVVVIIVVVIIVVVSQKKKKRQYQQIMPNSGNGGFVSPQVPPTPPAESPVSPAEPLNSSVFSEDSVSDPQKDSAMEDLAKLYELKEKGIITEEEFEAKKKQILGL